MHLSFRSDPEWMHGVNHNRCKLFEAFTSTVNLAFMEKFL
jgi:hypothetical protein